MITNAATQRIIAEQGKVVAIEHQQRDDDSVQQIPVAGVFIQLGLLPNSGFPEGLVELSDFGEIKINARCETSAAGIFACGDVSTVSYKQIVIATGDAAV